jgi:hypothetical protein
MDSRAVETKRLFDAWKEAGRFLSIEIIVPYRFMDGPLKADCIAFLPHFGGPHGMLVQAMFPPTFERDAMLGHLALRAGYYISFINGASYSVFDPDKYIETLVDWGYFGPAVMRPKWLPDPGPAHSS